MNFPTVLFNVMSQDVDNFKLVSNELLLRKEVYLSRVPQIYLLILLVKTFVINCPAYSDILKHIFLAMLIMVCSLESR